MPGWCGAGLRVVKRVVRVDRAWLSRRYSKRALKPRAIDQVAQHARPRRGTTVDYFSSFLIVSIGECIALIKLVDGLNIIEGNLMAGTEAISDFLFDDVALLPFLRKVSKSDGTVPYFEVLIEANSVNGSAGPFRILAHRTH